MQFMPGFEHLLERDLVLSFLRFESCCQFSIIKLREYRLFRVLAIPVREPQIGRFDKLFKVGRGKIILRRFKSALH
jgi:hypothetical protein